MLKAAAISTLLGVGTELGTSGQDALTKALRSGVQDSVSQTGRQIVQRELAVPPTITIRPGFPVRVLITSDLVFEPASPGTRP
jgi:type IV secretion system protein VirB10